MKNTNTEEAKRLSEKALSREEIFTGRVLHVVRDTVMLPNGNTSTREVALHNGAVCVVPITDNGEIVLERQFRYPFNEVIWEIPAGKLEKGESDPLLAAKRELLEETGYTAGNIEYIGEFYSSPAILSERIYMYIATELTLGERRLDDDEFLDVVRLPISTVLEMIRKNEIPDGKTQAAVLKALFVTGYLKA